MPAKTVKPCVSVCEKFTDNGEHSHWEVVDLRTGKVLWSEEHSIIDPGIFNEQTLRQEIVKVWGPAGAHVDVFDMLLKKSFPEVLSGRAIFKSSPSIKVQGKIFVWDGINSDLEEVKSIEAGKKYIIQNFIEEQDGIHPDVESVFIVSQVSETKVIDNEDGSSRVVFENFDAQFPELAETDIPFKRFSDSTGGIHKSHVIKQLKEYGFKIVKERS